MTLIKVKERTVLTIPSLFRQALRSVYELETMTVPEYDQMIESLDGWTKHFKLKYEGLMGLNSLDEENKEAIKQILIFIKQGQEGKLDQRKLMFKEKNIDWRKFHRLPESYTPADFAEGREIHSRLPKDEQ